jgi:hypothetical protein
MKATINGITVEGTPHEIMEFQQLQNEKMGIKPYQPLNQTNIDYQRLIKTQVTSTGSGATGKCPNQGYPCNCTGACKI